MNPCRLPHLIETRNEKWPEEGVDTRRFVLFHEKFKLETLVALL